MAASLLETVAKVVVDMAVTGFPTGLSGNQMDLGQAHHYVKDLHNYAAILASKSSSAHMKEHAVSMIGHIGYSGGLEVSQVLLNMMPDLMSRLLDDRHSAMQLHILRAISEIGHRNRAVQDMLLFRIDVVNKLIAMIENLTHVRLCRWACYTMLHLIVDNVRFTRAMQKRSDLVEALRGVVGLQLPWISWGANYGELLLTYLGDRTVSERMITKLLPDNHYYHDVVVYESDTTLATSGGGSH